MIELRAAPRNYRTSAEDRMIKKLRRDELRAKGLCFNNGAHGRAVKSSRCQPCADQLQRSR